MKSSTREYIKADDWHSGGEYYKEGEGGTTRVRERAREGVGGDRVIPAGPPVPLRQRIEGQEIHLAAGHKVWAVLTRGF